MTDAKLSGRPAQASAIDSSHPTVLYALKAAGPPLLFGLRLWASVCLALYVAFWLELDNAYWAGTTAAIVCQPHLGASLRKGWFRMIGTVVGAVAIVVLTACFPQDRAAFLSAWRCGAPRALSSPRCCATSRPMPRRWPATRRRSSRAINSARPAARTGKPSLLAVARASEICIGIVCAGVVLAGTDFGGARRRLATLFAAISAEITDRFTGTLALAGPEFDGDPAGPARARPAGHRARPGYRRGVRQVVPTALSLAGLAEGSGRFVRRPGRLAHGGGSCSCASRRMNEARQEAGVVLRADAAGACDRRRCKASRHAGWPIPPACAGYARRRYGGWSPCRRARRRCGCSPIRRRKCWPAFRTRSTGWHCSSTILLGLFLALAASALRVPDWLPALVNARARFRRDRRRRALLDRHRMAERRAGHHLRRDRRHPVRAASRPSLRYRHQLPDRVPA